MPASSQGLPTSLMRSTGSPQLAAGDLHGVDPGPVRAVALELVPALDGALLQLGLGADDLEVAAVLAVVDRQREAVVALLRDHPVVHVACSQSSSRARPNSGIQRTSACLHALAQVTLAVGGSVDTSAESAIGRARLLSTLPSMEMNHSSTRRKTSSELQRQQVG